MKQKFFITGNGTDVGKTIVAAIVCEALQADYWKPVQAGNLDHTDADFVKRMISHSKSVIHPETFRLTQPMSPHAAAKTDGVKIRLKDFQLPKTKNHLLIEGAGGLLVPLNQKRLVADLAKKLEAPLIIVCRLYLGSINHSLLTIEAAKRRGLKIEGIIFSGEPNEASEKIIQQHGRLKVLGRVNQEEFFDRDQIARYAAAFSAGYFRRFIHP
jgi:dethiobiotin synthetase